MPYVARPKRSAKLRVDENGPYSVVRGASGVAYSAIHKRWLARISYGGKRKHLGWFKTREAGEAIYSDARIARNKELFGEKV